VNCEKHGSVEKYQMKKNVLYFNGFANQVSKDSGFVLCFLLYRHISFAWFYDYIFLYVYCSERAEETCHSSEFAPIFAFVDFSLRICISRRLDSVILVEKVTLIYSRSFDEFSSHQLRLEYAVLFYFAIHQSFCFHSVNWVIDWRIGTEN